MIPNGGWKRGDRVVARSQVMTLDAWSEGKIRCVSVHDNGRSQSFNNYDSDELILIERPPPGQILLVPVPLGPVGSSPAEPIPMILHCPSCYARHLDEGEFKTRPHKTHTCQYCGMCWQPALVPTVGVQFLPGTKNE
jgi:hypothetical protein